MSLKIYYSFPHNIMSNTVKAAAAFSGAEYELVKITDEEKENFKNTKNPSGLFPYIEFEDQGLNETNSILRYIARLYPDSGLYGKSFFQSAKVDEVLDYSINLWSKALPLIFTALGHKKSTQAAFKTAKEGYVNCLKHLNTLLGDKDYFVGDALTIADLRVVGILIFPFRILMDPGTAKQIPQLIALFKRITSEEKFKTVFGTAFISKRPIKLNLVKEEKKKAKKEEVKKAPKPKAEKEKDPLEALPKSSMNLNDFKFWFINHANREEAFDEFVKERFDRKGWSIWDMKYNKYTGEGEFLYKTNNLLNGFIQRAEHFGKHSYGVHMIYGDEPDLNIKGVWMWRGLEIPQQLIDHPQFEYYTTTKLDIDDPKDQAYIKDMWCAKDGPLKDGTVIQNWSYQK